MPCIAATGVEMLGSAVAIKSISAGTIDAGSPDWYKQGETLQHVEKFRP